MFYPVDFRRSVFCPYIIPPVEAFRCPIFSALECLRGPLTLNRGFSYPPFYSRQITPYPSSRRDIVGERSSFRPYRFFERSRMAPDSFFRRDQVGERRFK